MRTKQESPLSEEEEALVMEGLLSLNSATL